MKINSLELNNFRGIDNHKIELNGKSTVFFGINGSGKTTVLRAINILFSQIVSKIMQNKFRQTILMEISDIKFGTSLSEIEVAIQMKDNKLSDKEMIYHRSMERKTNKRLHSKSLDQIATVFRETYIEDDKCNMPIFVNYGVNRVVIDIPLRVRSSHIFDKCSAFEKAVENKIDFRTFFEWFRNQEDYENQIKANEDKHYIDTSLESVRKAIYLMLDGFSNLRVQRNPLKMTISKGNKTLEMSQLSDGEKCTLALIGDLARRLSLANPTLNNPLEGEGIVLVDEIELHLHPTWQRRIIPTLRKIFPNIQFIITTHSPQVLGEINEDVNIFSLRQEMRQIEITKVGPLVGWDTNYILELFMETSSINLDTKGKISRMFELIVDKKFDEAEKFVSELQRLTDSANDEVVKAKILISRGKRGL